MVPTPVSFDGHSGKSQTDLTGEMTVRQNSRPADDDDREDTQGSTSRTVYNGTKQTQKRTRDTRVTPVLIKSEERLTDYGPRQRLLSSTNREPTYLFVSAPEYGTSHDFPKCVRVFFGGGPSLGSSRGHKTTIL